MKANTAQLLAAFLNVNHGWKADDVDAVAILLQENMKLDRKREKALLNNLRYVLNILSAEKNWGDAILEYLGNVVGTQAKTALTPNTQTIIFISRSTHKPSGVCKAAQSINKREKGFIGLVLDFPELGKLAVMGTHLKGWDAAQLRGMFPELIKQCGNNVLGTFL